MKRKNFCLYPFAALSLDNTRKPRICCNNNAYFRNGLNRDLLDPDFNIETDFNNELHKEVRRYIMKDRRHPSCKKCWDIEDNGAASYRQTFGQSFDIEGKNEDYWINKCDSNGSIKDIEFLYLDLTFGNKCNLKCTMCHEGASSSFLKERFEHGKIDESYYKEMLKLNWSEEDNHHMHKLDEYLSDVQRIHMTGGEPLLINHRSLLEKFINLGIADKIVLGYNTNLTVLPKLVFDCWKEFKEINVCVSVEGYKEMNEFIRFPSVWTKLENNIQQIKKLSEEYPSIRMQIHVTFSAFNCIEIPELLTWIKENSFQAHFNYVFHPDIFDPMHLPDDLKQIAMDNFLMWCDKNPDYSKIYFPMLESYYKKMMTTKGNPIKYRQFVTSVKFFENARGCKFPRNNNI